MKEYILYIKTHCIVPDFEAETHAGSKLVAARKFKQMFPYALLEWNIEDLLPFISHRL